MKKFYSTIIALLVISFAFSTTVFASTATPVQTTPTQPTQLVFTVGHKEYTFTTDSNTQTKELETAPFIENNLVFFNVEDICTIFGVSSFPMDEATMLDGRIFTSISTALGESLGYTVNRNAEGTQVTFQHSTTTVTATPPSADTTNDAPVPTKEEKHDPTDTEWKITGATSAVATVWNATATDKEEYKYLIEGDITFPKGSGGMLYYFNTIDDARRSYDSNPLKAGKDQPTASSPTAPAATPAPAAPGTFIKPSAAPTSSAPNQVVFDPNGEEINIQTEYWAVAELWNRSSADTAAYKYLIEPNQLRSFPKDTGGSIWFCNSKEAAERAFKDNIKPVGK